jgi:magnesium chelatase subunit I
MKIENINTLGELKESGYKSNSIKEELRSNLRAKIKAGEPAFEGVREYSNQNWNAPYYRVTISIY